MLGTVLALLLAQLTPAHPVGKLNPDPSTKPCPAGQYLVALKLGSPPTCAPIQGSQVQGTVPLAASATTAATATTATTATTAGHATTADSANFATTAGTATTATSSTTSNKAAELSINPTNCPAGQGAGGIAAGGTAEDCTVYSQPGHTHTGGSSGNLQTNDGAGGFGAYAGTSCAYALKTLDASGGSTCTAAPTIPPDLSAEPFVTSGSSAALSGERVLSAGTSTTIDTGTPGQIKVNVTSPVASASALAADPADCGAGEFAKGITAAGVASGCAVPPGTYTLPDASAGTKGGIQLAGDLGGTAGSPSVVDDSHAHTTSTVSGLDTSDVTTGVLAGARGGGGAALPTCSGTDKLTANGTSWSCAADQTSAGSATLTRLTASWASSATISTLGIVGTGGVPLTSPTISANEPFAASCVITTTRPATSNGPRYGVTASQTLTRVEMKAHLTLAGTAPAYTESLQRTSAVTSGACASGCTALMTATLAAALTDEIEILGVMGGTPGTVSLQMAPSDGAANTAQAGSYCTWY